MEVKTILMYYKQVKVRKKHLQHTENYEEFYYNTKVFVDYGLSTVNLKKSKYCTYRETSTTNNKNRFFFNWDSHWDSFTRHGVTRKRSTKR